MAITSLIINPADKGLEVSFKATDGRDIKGHLVESKFGQYLLSINGELNTFKLIDIPSIFAGGIRQSDALDLQAKLVDNEFYAEGVVVHAFSIFGGVFDKTTSRVRWGQKDLFELKPTSRNAISSNWLGEGTMTIGVTMSESLMVRWLSPAAKEARLAAGWDK